MLPILMLPIYSIKTFFRLLHVAYLFTQFLIKLVDWKIKILSVVQQNL